MTTSTETKQAYIWSIALNQPTLLPRLGALLNDAERARAARFHFMRDQERFAIARGMLRLILSQYTKLPPATQEFTYNDYGKPALAPQHNPDGLEFNLSHSGDFALCAVTYHHAVGVDVEQMREIDYLQLAATVFSTHEQTILRRLPPTQQALAFYNGWTRKEAYIKAHGLGLSMPLADFDVTLLPNEPVRLLATRPDATEAQRWSLYGWVIDHEHVAALAVAGSGWQLIHYDAMALSAA